MKATQVYYEGKVQGVGFRYTVRTMARGFDVTGWVQNLPDGRVELQVAGDAEEVQAFLQEIRDSSIAGHISSEQTHRIDVSTPFKGFQIIS